MNKKHNNLSENLFFLSYGIYLVTCILATSFYYRYIIGNPIKLLLAVCLGILLFREMVMEKYSLKSFGGVATIVIISVLTMISEQTFGYNSLVFVFIYSFSARNIKFEKIIRFTIICMSIVVVLVMGSSVVGIIPNKVMAALKGTVSYLGFRYSLYPAVFVSNITMLFLYEKKEQLKWKQLIILLLGNYLIYHYTISRLSFYLTVTAIFVALLHKYNPLFWEKKRTLCKAICASYLICYTSSILITLFYNPNSSWMSYLNYLTEGRIALQHKVVLRYGLNLLGKPIAWVGNALDAYGNRNTGNYMYADSLYINMPLMYGILASAIIFILLTMAMIHYYRKKDYLMLWFLAILAFHGLMDDLIQYLYYNTFLLVIGGSWSYLLNQRRKRIRLKF